MVQDGEWKKRRGTQVRLSLPHHVLQGNSSEVFKNSQFKDGLPEHYEGLLIKVGGWNIFYLAVSWLGLHIFKYSYICK